MSQTSVKLLRAASARLGGEKALAEHFGIGEALLDQFMADMRELPLPLLLLAVDVIIDNRGHTLPAPLPRLGQSIQELIGDR